MTSFECGLILGSLSTVVVGSGLAALLSWKKRQNDLFG